MLSLFFTQIHEIMSTKIAQQKIYEEKKEKTGKLSLVDLELDVIPKEIIELEHLQSLDLSENQISDNE